MVIRPQVGDERYAQLVDIAARARAHFAADPEGVTEDSRMGQRLLIAMEDVLKAAARARRAPDSDGIPWGEPSIASTPLD